MKIKVSELTGAALDWAVAVALDKEHGEARVVKVCRVEATTPAWIERENSSGSAPHFHRFSPSTDWAQCGPIIERERIGLIPLTRLDGYWQAAMVSQDCASLSAHTGPTPLIAAMRCYCSAKLGDEIDIPEESLQ